MNTSLLPPPGQLAELVTKNTEINQHTPLDRISVVANPEILVCTLGLNIINGCVQMGVRREDGKVTGPGGKADPKDIDIQSALYREVREEVGITPAQASLRGVILTLKNESTISSPKGTLSYVAKISYPLFETMEPNGEIDKFQWYNPDYALPRERQMFPSDTYWLRDAVYGLFVSGDYQEGVRGQPGQFTERPAAEILEAAGVKLFTQTA